MEYKEIVEKVQAIVAEKLSVDEKEIDLNFPLFESEFYDVRKKPYYTVTNWQSEDAQYYKLGVTMRGKGDSLEITEILMQLEEEFDLEISDEDASGFHTLEQAVDYISQRINSGS